ncbi:substrate-binding periplasmic protein [Rhodoferax sp.]|uniref:substrate-binding periplasmic protein n=1 Tax=Rhodoferax sp. TaxID=50421 RepID=UPI00277B119D|nr:transporter substrate-binding domain-containing protein [Rhodoferax sp.]
MTMTMTMIRVVAWITWLSLAHVGSARADQALLICDDAAGWPPYTFVDPKNPDKIVGASKDLIFGILERAGYAPQITLLPWKRCLAQVESGQVTMLLNASFSEERAQKFLMTRPYYRLHSVLFYRTSKYPSPPKLTTVQDMKSYRYCGLHGYNYTMYDIPKSQLDTGAKDEVSRFAMLKRDRCDFVLGDVEVLQAFSAMGQLDLDGTSHLPIPGVKPKEFHAMVSKALVDADKLLKILDDGIVAAKADKSYAKIFNRYGLEAR